MPLSPQFRYLHTTKDGTESPIQTIASFGSPPWRQAANYVKQNFPAAVSITMFRANPDEPNRWVPIGTHTVDDALNGTLT